MQEFVLSESEIVNEIEHIMSFLDEPLFDYSAIPVYFVSKLARSSVKTVVGGEGGDEFALVAHAEGPIEEGVDDDLAARQRGGHRRGKLQLSAFEMNAEVVPDDTAVLDRQQQVQVEVR